MGKEATRGIHGLTAIEVHKATADANDGGGLVLRAWSEIDFDAKAWHI